MSGVTPKIRLSKKILASAWRKSPAKAGWDSIELQKSIVMAQRVSEFYNSYVERETASGSRPMIMRRDVMQILGQMHNQKLYVCEQIKEGEPVLHAASMLWDDAYALPAANGYEVERCLEIGTQLSVLPGFNFQWTMTAITLLESFLFDPTGIVFAATYNNNDGSRENFLNTMKFVEWHDVPETIKALRMHHLEEEGDGRGVWWFRPTIATIVAAAERIADLSDTPRRPASPRGSGEIDFTFNGAEFEVVKFEVILDVAREIASARPKTRSELAAFSSALGERFLHFTPDELKP